MPELWQPDRNVVLPRSQLSPIGRGATVLEVMRMTPKQARYYLSEARFNMAPCGRRSGKTAIAKRRLVKKALLWTGLHGARFIASAPTHLQAKAIFWRDLKMLVPKWARARAPSESELVIELRNGAIIQVCGLDKPERIEGPPVAHFLGDEWGNTKPEAWGENIRPTLTDTQGTADIIGVPEGRNHYFQMWTDALSDETGEWACHTWFTAEVLPMYLGAELAAIEIASARATLDPLTYQQEYEASFNNFEGRIYYPFSRATHAAERIRYNPGRPLMLCFDFNTSPGVCGYAQDMPYAGKDPNVAEEITGIIGEVWIRKDSNTVKVCRKIAADWAGTDGVKPTRFKHQGEVHVYGDPSGGAKTTEAVQGSDYDLIRDHLIPVFGDRLRMRVKRSQPPVRVCINAVNTRFMTADGMKHMLVDPVMAPRSVEDFEAVCVQEGTAGEIDKDSDPMITHLSDGYGYMIEAKHPMRSVNKMVTGTAF